MKQIKAFLLVLVVIVVIFVAASLFDIVLAVLSSRFYSKAAFIVIFGVAGIFAGMIGFMSGLQFIGEESKFRLPLILLVVTTGVIFFSFLAKLEGGEYKPAFQSFGIMTALSGIGCLWWTPAKKEK